MTFVTVPPAKPDFPRDGRGRPLIIPVGGGKPFNADRTSKFGYGLSDDYSLNEWTKRMIADGFAIQRDLLDTYAAADFKGKTAAMLAASAVAGAHTKRNYGTEVHLRCEYVDLGITTVDDVPEWWTCPDTGQRFGLRADVTAYVATIEAHGLVVDADLVECRLVHDGYGLAGTADRFFRCADGRRRCFDLKTGSEVGKVAELLQLHAYATSQLYDVETGERTPIADVDTEFAYIIHIPAGTGTCTLHEVDLGPAADLARLAVALRDVRKRRKGYSTPIPTPKPLFEQYETMLVAEAAPSPAERRAKVPTSPAEGDDVPEDEWQPLREVYGKLDADARTWIGEQASAAARGNVPWWPKDVKSRRRFDLMRGFVTLAQFDAREGDTLRGIVALVIGSDEWPWFANVEPGHAVGALDADEAARFLAHAQAFVTGCLSAHVDGAGRLVLAPTAAA